MHIIDGKELAKKVQQEVKEKLQNEKFKSIPSPHLVVIQVGDNKASEIYIRNKKKACEDVGIKFSHYHYNDNLEENLLISIIKKLSLTPSVTGILVQLPLPAHINTQNIIDYIDPMKDIDGFTTTQAGMLQLGMKNKNRLVPCTAKGIVRLLESVIDLEGEDITIVGRSNIVGKPLAQLLQEKNATVTLCHSKTEYLNICTSNSDIVVLATGKPEYFDRNYFNETAIIIDAGISRNNEGKLCGDLNLKSLKENAYYDNVIYTPVPGGVGPMTIAELLDNIYIAYENQFDFIWHHYQSLQISEAKLNNFE